MALLGCVVLLWVAWLLWNGRANSPRRRREDARWEYWMEQTLKDMNEKGVQTPPDVVK